MFHLFKGQQLLVLNKYIWHLVVQAIPVALARAATEDVEFRRGLPRNYLGIEFEDNDNAKLSFTSTAQTLMSKLATYLPFCLGDGVDQLGAQLMHDALPPVLTLCMYCCTIY